MSRNKKMAIKWFDASNAEQFGQSLAKFFIERIPLSPEEKKGKQATKLLTKQFEVIDKMYLQIEQFKLTNKLNIYKKAKFGSAFKFKLIETGFDPAFADYVTKGLVQKL